MERSPDGTSATIALDLDGPRDVTALLGVESASYALTSQSADARTFQAATGRSPGWWTLRSAPSPRGGMTRVLAEPKRS